MNNAIGFVSLGCAKATYDSERLLTQIRTAGYQLVGDHQSADLIVINTCGFIDDAIAESIEEIKQARSECDKVIVTGCLGVKKKLIEAQFTDLLAITPPQSDNEVLSVIAEHLPIELSPFENLIPNDNVRVKLSPKHYAWLKIAEGCNQNCSFCIIPTMRGKLKSRHMSEILNEAERLLASGVKELLIVAQDTAAFGVDRKYRLELINGQMVKSDITELARALGSLGIWVRLHYLYPYPKIDQLVELMAEGLILPYLDMPLQHASHDILRQMRRPANSENMLKRIAHWRSICPDLAIRTTLIAGFPGEHESDFDYLHDFIQEARFDRLGVFTYSPVKGASANMIDGAIDEEIKQLRQEILLNTQMDISFDKLKNRVGKIERVMVDEEAEGGVIARSRFDAPEIDGVVHVHSEALLEMGDLVNVRITNHDAYDLEAVYP